MLNLSPFDDILLPRDLTLACGKRVFSPTVYHGWVLESLRSPYIDGGRIALEDFAFSACLLSQSVVVLRGLGLAVALKKMRPDIDKMAEFYAGNAEAFKADSDAFTAFFAESLKGYRVKRAAKEGAGSGMPFVYGLAVLLRHAFKMGVDEVMAYPLKLAILDSQTLYEIRGGRSIISAGTARLLDAIAERKKAKKGKT